MRQNKKDQVVVASRTNKFAVLALSDSDSDGDSESEVEVEQKSAPAPLAKNQSREFWTRKTHVKKDADGWNTVQQKPRPNFISEDDEEKVIRREIEEEAASVGVATIWAEKIRESLERAESVRVPVSEGANKGLSNDFISSLDKLSFFRKPVAQA
jgi:hypothetical protein